MKIKVVKQGHGEIPVGSPQRSCRIAAPGDTIVLPANCEVVSRRECGTPLVVKDGRGRHVGMNVSPGVKITRVGDETPAPAAPAAPSASDLGSTEEPDDTDEGSDDGE
jgi:hypothetical protein